MNKWRTLSLILWFMAQSGHAQHTLPVAKEAADYLDAVQLWRGTLNAAGLSRDTMVNRGVSFFDVEHQEGSHYLMQNGNEHNSLTFVADRYQSVGKYLYGYGSVRFDMKRDFERSWSDNLRSHHSNPYISGSSIPGKYDTQNIDFTAALATLPWARFTYGMRLDYKVGDFSRLQDPRSRVNLLDYRIAPSVTYAMGRHTIGVGMHYRRRKEKLGSILVVQTDPNLKYYQATGMEHMKGAVGLYSSYQRQYVDHEFGAELSYDFRHGDFHSLTSLTLNNAKEDIHGVNKYTPAAYYRKEFVLATQNRLQRAGLLHLLDFSVAYRPQHGNEYKQQKLTTKDPETGIDSGVWVTQIAYNKRYEVNEVEALLRYRTMWQQAESRAYAGLSVRYLRDKDEHHLPESRLEIDGTDVTLELGARLLRHRRQSLWADAELGCHAALTHRMNLYDATTEFAQAVLLPDMEYYGASWGYGKLRLTYQFPLTVRGVQRNWFVGIHGHYLSTNRHTYAWSGGVRFGIYY